MKSFAFVQAGSFSHTNEYVLKELRRSFPELQADVIDLHELESCKGWLPRLSLAVAKEYGVRACFPLSRLRRHAIKTGYFFDRTRRALAERMQGRQYAFTLQTQSMFDASTSTVPHFLYTDHTHLANLTYPGFSPANLSSRSWIDLERSAYHNATVNFTMSTNIVRSLVEQYGCTPDQVECVYAGHHVHAVNLDELPADRYARKKIVFVGVEWERKGGPALLEAFRRVRKKHPTAQLTVVGCSPEIDEPGCEVIGLVPLAQVAEFYKQASVFCLPTQIEPFGIVFLEAFAHGLPVVATNIGAIPDFVQEGASGYLVEPNDVSALADRLSALLENPSRCAEFGKRGYDLVRERYTWSATGERMAARIKQSMARWNTPRAA